MEQEESLHLEKPDHELEHVYEKIEDVSDHDWYCECRICTNYTWVVLL